MSNLYSVTNGQSAIRDLFAVKHDRAGNLPPLPVIFPDQMAPILRVAARRRAQAHSGALGLACATAIRRPASDEYPYVKSTHWR